MRIRLMLTSALLACFAVSACGAEGESTPSADSSDKAHKPTAKATAKAAPVTGPRGTWAFKWHGATGNVLIPAPSTDPRLTEIEGYRKRAKAKPVCYAIVEVDNTHGTDEVFMGALDSDAPGVDAEYGTVGDWVALWEKNRGGGSETMDELMSEDVRPVKLRHPYDNIQYAPGEPDSASDRNKYVTVERGTTVFVVDEVEGPGGFHPCGEQHQGPATYVTLRGLDDIPTIHATKVPTSATP